MSRPEPRNGQDRFRRWAAVGVFALFPWCVGALNRALSPPEETTEGAEKVNLLAWRGPVDTVLAGDSRVMTIRETAFASYGWRFFNMGLSGMSPEDVVLQFAYARSRHPVRRLILGLSFENMTERFPYEFSRYRKAARFRHPAVLGVAGWPQGRNALKLRLEDLYDWFPVGRAASTVLYLQAKSAGQAPPATSWLPDGSIRYEQIEEQIREGQYDFAKYRKPEIFFNRPDFEARYLETGSLSPDARKLFLRLVDQIRNDGTTAVMFETATTADFDRRIEGNPALARLRREWRAFFRAQSRGCVRFLEAGEMRAAYADADFIDAVHYIGKTSERVGAALARELHELEATCR